MPSEVATWEGRPMHAVRKKFRAHLFPLKADYTEFQSLPGTLSELIHQSIGVYQGVKSEAELEMFCLLPGT